MSEIEAVDLEKKLKKNQGNKKEGRPFNNRPPFKKRFRNQVWVYDQKQQQFRPSQFRGNQINRNRQEQQRQRFIKTGRKVRQQKQQTNPKPPKQQKQQNQANQRPKPNVIIKGLDNYSDEELLKLCRNYGPMDLCLMERDNFGNLRPEGIGLVAFEKIEYAQNCVQALNGAVLTFGDQKQSQQSIKISAKVVGQAPVTEENKGSIKITRLPIKKNQQYILNTRNRRY